MSLSAHVDAVELIHHVCQHAGRGHHEEGVPHVVCVGGASVAMASMPRPRAFMKGNTSSRTVANIFSGALSLKRDQRIASWSGVKIGLSMAYRCVRPCSPSACAARQAA